MINKERDTLRNWLTAVVLRVRLKDLIEEVRKKGFGSSKITKEGLRGKDTCTPGDKQVASKKT